MIRAQIHLQEAGFELDVDFESQGPVLGIFGPSGSGKSTLLQALAGWRKPERCRMEVRGRTLGQIPGGPWLPPEERRLGIVPQNGLLFPHLSVERNLVFSPGADQRLASPEGQQIVEWLRLVPLLARRTDTLSGGERQRVALGRAWLSDADMLLLDEPAASLDADLAREVIALLLQAKSELQKPMVFVTHRASELLALADDCLVLDRGRVVAQGPPLDVLANSKTLAIDPQDSVDNLFRGTVHAHHEPAGITEIELGAHVHLRVPLADAEPGAKQTIGLRAEDIILCERPPGTTSARNTLEGTIESLSNLGHALLVTVRVGDCNLRAKVTPGAAAELGLQPGKPVYLLIKTHSCHLLG
ncbi:MAG: molybdenum ABC transporter ATP-binding protein [Planctomycetes bacterium]|nr:molybdenum ABC transporter ATP-binding protein [Planctomycetota bacterium]